MCSSVSNFIKTHRCLCMMTLGIAIVAYLGYRAVVVIKDKCCPTTTKTKAVAKNVLDQSATPPVPQKDPFANLTSIQRVAKKVLDQVYDEFTGATPATPFAFRIFVKDTNDLEEAPLYLEYDEAGVKTEKPLTEVIDAVAWQALDKKWEQIAPAKLEVYKSKALSLKLGFLHPYPFLSAYLDNYFSMTNSFLRFGKILALSSYVSHPFSDSEKINRDIIHMRAKELFFTCAATAGTLQGLPISSSPQYVCRIFSLDQKTIKEIYQVGKEVTEKAFTSTSKSMARMKHTSPVKMRIRRLPASAGKDVQPYQLDKLLAKEEEECLFPPFTKFKVTKLDFKAENTYIEMDEVAS